jgi:hypothetical protein
MDDDLEIGIAAGLDVPTAIVLSEQGEDPPPPEKPRGCLAVIVLAVLLAGVVAMFLTACNLRYAVTIPILPISGDRRFDAFVPHQLLQLGRHDAA